MSNAIPESSPPTSPFRRAFRIGLRTVTALLLVVIGWVIFNSVGRLWSEYRTLTTTQREAEDNAPIGYIGTAFRRTYYNRPPHFLHQEDGRKLLFAIRDEDKTEYYDVTDAEMNVESLSGGYGRDSNPGIDYPIFEPADSERGRRLRSRQVVYGIELDGGPRAYPADLLRRVEVVNDRDGDTPFAIIYDRSRDRPLFIERRKDGKEYTIGTTGYAHAADDPVKGEPLLYDRRTRSLWLLKDKSLVCVNGELKGTILPGITIPPSTTWSAWHAAHPKTVVLMGNDRSKPIPSE